MNINNNLTAPYKARMTDGNIKVDAYLFSLPPIKSCLNCDSCKSSCYALKAYKQYPNVQNLWDKNFNNDLISLYNDLNTQLKTISKQAEHKRVVRIHQSGDFYSLEYIMLWARLANKFKNILFYGYTKVLDHSKYFNKAINQLKAFDNVNIIESFIPNTKRKNFGSYEYAQRMSKKYDLKVCPVNKHNPKMDMIKCGLNRDTKYNKKGNEYCDHCLKNDNVCFVQH